MKRRTFLQRTLAAAGSAGLLPLASSPAARGEWAATLHRPGVPARGLNRQEKHFYRHHLGLETDAPTIPRNKAREQPPSQFALR